MSVRKLLVTLSVWIAAVTGLHLWLNFDWESLLNDARPERERKLDVAYVPVT